MDNFGILLSSEEHGPRTLVHHAQLAEQAGFSKVMISDHYHPWIDRQGQSPFVWSVIGGIAATTGLEVTTGVTCPTVRIHPAVLAQAAATASLMLDGRFRFGVGTGEALNEHILGDRWPAAGERLDMLEEAIQIIRQLWEGGVVDMDTPHYRVVGARIYSLPDRPPPVLMSAFGEKAARLAGRLADGLIGVAPTGELIETYASERGQGRKVGTAKVCWGDDEAAAKKLAFSLWPSSGIPGELNQELPMPAHFEQAVQNVTEDDVTGKIVCGPDPQRYVDMVAAYREAGYDELFISQVGEDLDGFLTFFRREVEPRL